MSQTNIQFVRNRLRWALPLVIAGVFVLTAAIVPVLAGVTITTIFAALLLLGLGLSQARNSFRWYQCGYPLIEVLDYCIIDLRSFNDWVYWQDVKEIVISDSGAIFLRVENEERYARQKVCFCEFIARLFGIEIPSKLLLSPIGLDCSFSELLAVIRTASRPYHIPFRRLPSSASQAVIDSRPSALTKLFNKSAARLALGQFHALFAQRQ
jgi:hypothetical protein